jgi:hypothetical protein
MKNMKRIHKVVIKRMYDESPDTSWLGEYSNKQTSEFSIDREHSLECSINTGMTPLDYKTRTLANVAGKCECADSGCKVHAGVSSCPNQANTILYRVDMEDLSGTLCCDDCANDATTSGLFTEADDPELAESQCDCGESGDMQRNEYQYFNPSFNYVDKQGHAKDMTPADARKYTHQDYERMEDLHKGNWCFIGISAEAEYSVGGTPATIQRVTSGGLWGIEPDSPEYLKEIESEQLSELKQQLKAIGFSSRAIATAFKNVEESGDAR